MDGCCNRDSCSSWRKQKDEDEDGDEENHKSSTTKDHNAQTDLDRDYENLDDNTYFNESQLPAQQPISNVSNTSDLTCSCKTVISNVDPYSTYEPCEQQECCVHDEKAQEAEQIYAPKPKTCQRQQPIYPSKYTRKIVTASEISTTSTTPSSIQIGCTCDKSTTTSESQLDNYPVHLCLRMSKNITKLPPQQKYRKEQEMTDVVPWCGYLQNNSALVCDDNEQYFSCDSDSSAEEGYGEALEPCHFPPPCASNQVTDRNLYILKLLREIVNLIHDDSPIREEAVRIANKQPMASTTSESKFSAPTASRICPAPHPLEPLGIFRPGKETKNPDYVCISVDPQTMLPEPTKSDTCKRSYKSFPPEPIMPKYSSDEGPLCICPQQTDVCPTHGLIADILKNTEDECTCEEEIKIMEISKDVSSKTKTVSDYLDENECTCLEEMEEYFEENECTCLEEMEGHIEENLGENLEESLAENLEENLEENLGEILGENLEDNLGEILEENLEDEDLLCICPTEDDVCPVHGTRIAPIQSTIKKPCDESDKNIEPYDPCSNFKEYKIYSLPDELLEKQPPIWGAKQKELEEDIFPDVGCDCDDDDTLDEKDKDESKLLYEEEEQMNIKDESNVYDEGEEEQTKAKDESKLYNEEEEYECRLETIPETEEQCDLTYDSQAQGATGTEDEPCSFDEDLDCEEFEEECELLKELMAECRKKRGKDGESKEGECDCCHCRAQRSGQNQCTALATTQQAIGPVDDELKYFIDSLIVDLEAMQHARRKCAAQANICMPKPATCSRESFPVTITDVIELGNRSLYVKWKIHECCGISGYEIFLDGYLTNRYYHSRHEAAVITDVDITIPHKIALVAQASNDDDSIALFCQELKNTHKCKSLPWKTDCYKEKPTCPPPPSALWIPSIYMYDPLDCKESPPFRKSLI